MRRRELIQAAGLSLMAPTLALAQQAIDYPVSRVTLVTHSSPGAAPMCFCAT